VVVPVTGRVDGHHPISKLLHPKDSALLWVVVRVENWNIFSDIRFDTMANFIRSKEKKQDHHLMKDNLFVDTHVHIRCFDLALFLASSYSNFKNVAAGLDTYLLYAHSFYDRGRMIIGSTSFTFTMIRKS
jgi:hypothetical protein